MEEQLHNFNELHNEIAKLTKPLKQFGIDCFSFLRRFNDFSEINLSNLNNWVIDYYQHKLYQTSLFELDPKIYQSSYLIWPIESKLKVFDVGKHKYYSNHGITIINKSKNFCDFYFFSTKQPSNAILNFYINHLDKLCQFVQYFKTQTKDLLIHLEKNKIKFKNSHQIDPNVYQNFKLIEKNIMPSQQKVNLFINEINGRSIFVNKNFTQENISKREKECLIGLLQGKTAEQIGIVLSLSKRTVEKYFENLKNKLGCQNKTELLVEAIRNYHLLIIG